MSGERENQTTSGWTIDTLAQHVAELRAADDLFREERDRRYSEVATEREKALRIKEQADRDALGLAREIQTYKDEKANELRKQIDDERGHYATRNDLTAATEKLEEALKPLNAYVSSQQGPRALTGGMLISLIGVVAILAGLYFGFKSIGPASSSSPAIDCSATYHPSPCPAP